MKRSEEKRVHKTITLNREVHDRLQNLSRDKNVAASMIIEKLLRNYFDRSKEVK